MTTHVLFAELPKPDVLAGEPWVAILDPFERLKGAVRAGDRPLTCGSPHVSSSA